jgi:hypothetical protein
MPRFSLMAVSASVFVTIASCPSVHGINTTVMPVGPGSVYAQASSPSAGSSTTQTSSPTSTIAGAQTTNEGENALNLGDYPRAEKYFAATLKNSSANISQEIGLRTGYGEALLWQDKISEAAAQFKKAKALASGRNGQATPQQLVRLSDDYSWLAQAQNKTDQSIQYAQESVQEAQSDKTIPPLTLISSLTHLAYLQDSNDQLEKAAAIYKAALAVDSSASPQKSLLRADIMEELAGVQRRLGKTQEANEQFKEGLQIKLQANAPLTQYEPHPYWNDVIYRFQLGAPNCLRSLKDGKDVEIITANGITVAAMMSSESGDLVKSGRVDLSIKNDSDSRIQVLPRPAVFYTLLPKVRLARQLDPTQLATSIEKKGEKKAKWIRFMGANATQTVSTTMIGNGGFYGFPPVYSSNGTFPIVNRSGNMTTIQTQVPDYPAQERALAKAAAIGDQSRNSAEEIRRQGIGPTTISPGESVNGSLFFDVSKVQKASLQIPIGNALFEFTFPPR